MSEEREQPTTESSMDMRKRVLPSSPVAFGVREDGALHSLTLKTITLDRDEGVTVVQVLPSMKYKVIVVDDQKIGNVEVIDRDRSAPDDIKMKTLSNDEVLAALKKQLVPGGSVIRTSRLEVR